MKTENNQTEITPGNEQKDNRDIDNDLQDAPMSNPLPKPLKKRNVQKKSVLSRQTEKDVEAFVQKVSNESRGVLHTLHDFVGGEWKDQLQPKTRGDELKKIRLRKNKNRELEISR